MSFGYAASHRAGKTSLAKQVAEDLGYFFHDGSVSQIMRDFGINAVGDIPLQQRIEAQEFLLGKFLEKLKAAPRPMITDRTPLDMIGYMLGEITMHNTDPVLGKRIDNYVQDCLEATISHFDTIIILRPLPFYVEDPKSPPPNPAYQSLVQFLIEGAARQVDDAVFVQTMLTTDFGHRRRGSTDIFGHRLMDLAREAQNVIRH